MFILSEKDRAILAKANKVLEKAATYQALSLTSPELVVNYLRGKIGFEPIEHFLVMYLDSQNQLIESVIESSGSIDSARVYPRNIAKKALELSAASVILSHNHPSGKCEPSHADIDITRKLQESLMMFDIRVLDHVIVSGGFSYSFAEKGKM